MKSENLGVCGVAPFGLSSSYRLRKFPELPALVTISKVRRTYKPLGVLPQSFYGRFTATLTYTDTRFLLFPVLSEVSLGIMKQGVHCPTLRAYVSTGTTFYSRLGHTEKPKCGQFRQYVESNIRYMNAHSQSWNRTRMLTAVAYRHSHPSAMNNGGWQKIVTNCPRYYSQQQSRPVHRLSV